MKYSLLFLLYISCEFLSDSYKFPVVMLSICQHSAKQLQSQAISHVVHSILRMVYKCITISRNSLKVLIFVCWWPRFSSQQIVFEVCFVSIQKMYLYSAYWNQCSDLKNIIILAWLSQWEISEDLFVTKRLFCLFFCKYIP